MSFSFRDKCWGFDQRQGVYANYINEDKESLFASNRSVLYALVKKSDWLSDEEYYAPLNVTPIEAWPQVPILKNVFQRMECNLFQVYNGRNGAEFNSKTAASDCRNTSSTKTFDCCDTAARLHDLLFANFGHSVWEVCETSSTFWHTGAKYVTR